MTTDKTNLSSTYLCPRCNEWWGVPLLQATSCAVKHNGGCCHYGEVRVPIAEGAPTKGYTFNPFDQASANQLFVDMIGRRIVNVGVSDGGTMTVTLSDGLKFEISDPRGFVTK